MELQMCVFEYCEYSTFLGPKAHCENYTFLASSYLLYTHLCLLKEKKNGLMHGYNLAIV